MFIFLLSGQSAVNHDTMNKVIKLLIFALPFIVSCTHKELEVRVESVTMSLPSAELEIGETLKLSATVSPSNATKKDIVWSSSNTSVASVSASGLVTALSEGTTTITATADGKKGECSISITKAYVAVTEIRFEKEKLSLYEGEEVTLTATVLPEEATDKTITWSSSDNTIASVESGKVKAIKEGIATITASAGTVKAECMVSVVMSYAAIAITDLKPVEILPIIGQVEVGDIKVYDHIEHLRLAEATRIRDMMWEYGASPYSADEYRSLIGRLEVMMVNEVPPDYDKNDIICLWQTDDEADSHSKAEWDVLNNLIKHSALKAIYGPLNPVSPNGHTLIWEYSHDHPERFIILAQSTGADYDEIRFRKEYENEWHKQDNVLQFSACMNRFGYHNGRNIFQVCQIDAEYPDDESTYGEPMSYTNGKNDIKADRHHIVTIGSSKSGVMDYSDDPPPHACFPIGFHDDVLFAGRAFPHISYTNAYPSGKIGGEWSAYSCSVTNYVNAAMAGICFQLKADTKNVDELLDMLRSTSLTDYAHKDGITQPLHLINLAGVYKKYLTPQDLPTIISAEETVTLDKGYYKGVLFSIPGAQVKINGEWVAFDNKNKDLILSQNPMTMEWRLNGELLKRYGYSSGQTVEGKIITVDDKWGGLRLEVPMTIRIQ